MWGLSTRRHANTSAGPRVKDRRHTVGSTIRLDYACPHRAAPRRCGWPRALRLSPSRSKLQARQAGVVESVAQPVLAKAIPDRAVLPRHFCSLQVKDFEQATDGS